MAAYPWDMCLITPSEVAVALGDHGVQFITVTQSKLVPGRRLQLQHKCYGIVHDQGDLFICSNTALYKYSLSGKLVFRLNVKRHVCPMTAQSIILNLSSSEKKKIKYGPSVVVEAIV